MSHRLVQKKSAHDTEARLRAGRAGRALDGGLDLRDDLPERGGRGVDLQLLDEIEALPFITGRSLEEPGSVADEVRVQPHSTHMALATALAHSSHCLACVLCACTQVFKAQKSLFSGLSKGLGDQRAEDRTGKLLRRVEITNCGLP